jgi:hypothetical protein
MVHQDVAGAVGADQVGIDHPDHVDALGGEPFLVPTDVESLMSAHRCLLGGTVGWPAPGRGLGRWREGDGARARRRRGSQVVV